MFPNGAPTDRDTLSPEPLAKRGDSIYSFMYVCWSPQKGALLHTYRKSIRSPFTELPQTEGLHNDGVRHGSPRGLLTTLQSLPQCHAGFGTIPGLGRPVPC